MEMPYKIRSTTLCLIVIVGLLLEAAVLLNVTGWPLPPMTADAASSICVTFHPHQYGGTVTQCHSDPSGFSNAPCNNYAFYTANDSEGNLRGYAQYTNPPFSLYNFYSNLNVYANPDGSCGLVF